MVLDEAHHLPRIGAEFFGEGWSLAQVGELASDTLAAGLHAARDGAPWIDLTRSLDQAARAVRASLAQAGLTAGARVALERLGDREELKAALGTLQQRASELNGALERNAGRDPDLDLLMPRLQRLRALLHDWHEAAGGAHRAEPAADGLVRWISASSSGAQFHATPLSIRESFLRARQRAAQAWVLTSATLTVASRPLSSS